MSTDIERIKNDITYSINIQTSSTPRRPLTCYITATPQTSNQLNYLKPSICLENKSRSTVHLPVTYSTSIQVPCRPPIIAQPSPIILPSPSSHYHHYHHYHHHYYYHHHHHHQQQSLPRSTTIKHKISPRPTSIASTRPATTSTTTITSPESSSSPSKKTMKNICSNKQSTPPPPPPLPSYSTLVWNWFHHTSTKPSSPHKGSQSDYSETYRHEVPNKRSLLFKLLTSPIEKSSKCKHHRPCFTRKRLESSSSLPNKSNHYHE